MRLLTAALGSLSLLGFAIVLAKLVAFNESTIESYRLYSPGEMRLAVLGSHLAVLLAGLALIAAVFSARTLGFDAPRNSAASTVGGYAARVGLWYVATFVMLHATSGRFTRIGGTTPVCYDDPLFAIFEPPTQLAHRLGWHGGDRYTRDWFHPPQDGTWQRPLKPTPPNQPSQPTGNAGG